MFHRVPREFGDEEGRGVRGVAEDTVGVQGTEHGAAAARHGGGGGRERPGPGPVSARDGAGTEKTGDGWGRPRLGLWAQLLPPAVGFARRGAR
ncbi:hypothetical protein GCM10027168_53040 [Streptomyces capparidis]